MAITPPPAYAWITTPPHIGPIPSNAYTCTISGLSQNTIYLYRAYMVIDGVSYYGEICETSTLSIPISAPVVSTGHAGCVTTNNMRITGNTVTDKGNLSVGEYGILYTQNPSYGTASTLKYENYPSHVCIKSKSVDIGVNVPYFTGSTCEIQGLNENTTTFYRAFAKNASGCGYGIVKSEQTEATIPSTVYLSSGSYLTSTPSLICACGKIFIDPPLTVGQSLRLNFTDTACSISSTSTLTMSACAWLSISSSVCGCACSSLSNNVGMDNLNCTVGCSRYIDINHTTNLDNYTFYVKGASHSANAVKDYCNGASVWINSITNQVGGAYVLAEEPYQYMSVYNANVDNGGVSCGHISTGIV